MPSESEQGVGPTDFRCHGCGYDISGTVIGSRCPECGMAISESLLTRSNGSRYSGHAVASMVCGIASLTVCGLVGPVAIVLYFTAMSQIRSGGFASGSRTMAIVGLVLGIIATLLHLGLGMLWVLTF
ncbi:MAG: DUF4190 domain-containing protein [Planctomycetota bacterium]|jgi:hypothetical protein